MCSKPHASATEEEIHSTFALKSLSLKLPSATCSRGAFVDSCILEVETFLCRCLVLWIQVFTNLFDCFLFLFLAFLLRRRFEDDRLPRRTWDFLLRFLSTASFEAARAEARKQTGAFSVELVLERSILCWLLEVLVEERQRGCW